MVSKTRELADKMGLDITNVRRRMKELGLTEDDLQNMKQAQAFVGKCRELKVVGILFKEWYSLKNEVADLKETVTEQGLELKQLRKDLDKWKPVATRRPTIAEADEKPDWLDYIKHYEDIVEHYRNMDKDLPEHPENWIHKLDDLPFTANAKYLLMDPKNIEHPVNW